MSLKRTLTLQLVILVLSGSATATEAIVPALTSDSTAGVWEGVGHDRDLASDAFHIVRFVAKAGGRGELTIGMGFEDERAATQVLRFDIRNWSAKQGFVTAGGRASAGYERAFRLKGRGKGVFGHGRVDVTIDLLDERGRRLRSLSAVLVQDDGIAWLSRIETGLRRARAAK